MVTDITGGPEATGPEWTFEAALDRLGELDLARRKVDPMDRRSVIVQRTLKGTAFLRDMRQIMSEAETQVHEMPAVEPANAEASRDTRKVG